MLDEKTRSTILALHAAGHGKRAVARLLGISRNATKQVIVAGTSAVSALDRAEKAEPYHDELVRLVGLLMALLRAPNAGINSARVDC